MILKAAKKIVPKSMLNMYRDYKRKKEMRAFAGNNVVCPICTATFKQFGIHGSEKRTNARCLSCGSLERHRLLWLFLHANTNLFDGQQKRRVLHIAPEKCFYDVFTKNSHIEYFAGDLFPEVYNYGGKIKIMKVDVTDIPFADNYFDAVICNHVLEHVPDDKKAMQELFRVTKKNGWGVYQVPIDYKRPVTYEDATILTQEDRKKAFGQSDHVRIYGADYKYRLEQAGFGVTEDHYVQSIAPDMLKRYALMHDELIYYCKK